MGSLYGEVQTLTTNNNFAELPWIGDPMAPSLTSVTTSPRVKHAHTDERRAAALTYAIQATGLAQGRQQTQLSLMPEILGSQSSSGCRAGNEQHTESTTLA